MLLLIVILFLICWGPRLIMNVAIKLGLESFSNLMYSARVGVYLLSFIHSALNPFVYGLMSSNFRDMILKSCRARRKNRSNALKTSCPPELGGVTEAKEGNFVKNNNIGKKGKFPKLQKNAKGNTSNEISLDPLSAHAVLGAITKENKVTVIDARGKKKRLIDKKKVRRGSSSKPLLSFLSSASKRDANHFEITNPPLS